MPQTDVERLSVLIEANTKSYERAMVRVEKNTNKAIRKSSASFKVLDKTLKTASRGAVTLAKTFAGAFGGALAIGGVSSLAGALRGVTAEMSKLAENADKVGLSVENLQLVRLAGEEMGIAVSQADTAMQRFSRRIAEASTGSGDLAKVLKANNVELRDQEGNLRPQIDILKDYADLIKNAGSDQERLLLAFKAFDTEGASFVNVLRDGADGLESVFNRQRKLNNLFDEETVRALKDVDQSFVDFTNTLEVNTKKAIVGIIKDVRDLGAELEGFSTTLGRILINTFGHVETQAERSRGALKALLKSQQSGLSKGFDGSSFDNFFGPGGRPEVPGTSTITQKTDKPATTKIPGTGSGGPSKADQAAKRQAERIRSVVEALKFQEEQLGRTADQQAVYNQLKAAGVTLESQAGKEIEALTLNLEAAERQTKALEDAQAAALDTAQFFADSLLDGVLAIASGAAKAEDVVKGLALSLADAALQATLFGRGPLSGLLGGSGAGSGGAGLLGSLFSALPGFATGGSVRIGGAGGPDSQLFAARVTPGEQIDFRPPGMVSPPSRGAGNFAPQITINGNVGDREIVQLRREISDQRQAFDRAQAEQARRERRGVA